MQPINAKDVVAACKGEVVVGDLDTLLELPQLNAIQLVYGAGNGPAARWIDVYRRIQSAGKSIQLLAEGPQDALACLKQLDPKGLWLDVGSLGSVDEANAFLRDVARACLGR